MRNTFQSTPETLKARFVDTDRRRAEYIRRFHQREWDDRRLYHLMLNSCMGLDAMVESTVEAAGLHAVAAAAEHANQEAVS